MWKRLLLVCMLCVGFVVPSYAAGGYIVMRGNMFEPKCLMESPFYFLTKFEAEQAINRWKSNSIPICGIYKLGRELPIEECVQATFTRLYKIGR